MVSYFTQTPRYVAYRRTGRVGECGRGWRILGALEEVCARTADPDAVRSALTDLSWALLDATLSAVPREALMGAAMAAERHDHSLSGEHRRLLQALKEYAAAARSA